MVALGEVQLLMDQATQASLNATKGVKVSAPAQVVVDERGQ